VRFVEPFASLGWKLAFSVFSTLGQLSSEFEGHPMGGGMLKMEPSEAANLLIVRPEWIRAEWKDFKALDHYLRKDSLEDARELADQIILRRTLRIDSMQILELKAALVEMASLRRKSIGKED